MKNGVFKQFLERAEEHGIRNLFDDIRSGYEERSPSGGIHWLIFIRSDCPGNAALASIREVSPTTGKYSWRPLVEIRGEGGYAIIAPSSGPVHESDRRWELLQGGSESIDTVTSEEFEQLCALAREFDQKAQPLAVPRSSATATRQASDDFEERSDWASVLTPHGWTFAYAAPKAGNARFTLARLLAARLLSRQTNASCVSSRPRRHLTRTAHMGDLRRMQFSTGRRMPFSGAVLHEPIDVTVMTSEDGLADTVVPRLLAAGADLERMHAVIARKRGDEYEAPISLPEDVDALRAHITETGSRSRNHRPLVRLSHGKR